MFEYTVEIPLWIAWMGLTMLVLFSALTVIYYRRWKAMSRYLDEVMKITLEAMTGRQKKAKPPPPASFGGGWMPNRR